MDFSLCKYLCLYQLKFLKKILVQILDIALQVNCSLYSYLSTSNCNNNNNNIFGLNTSI